MGDAENIVQDFFLYLWERKEILPELQQPDAYLFSAVKHRCLNFLRSQLSIVDRRPVSYTHLDVYKRQAVMSWDKQRKYADCSTT